MSNHTPDTIEIQISKGYTVVMDAVDADLAALKWYSVNKNGRIYVWRKHGYGDTRKLPTAYLHRMIFERMYGKPLNSKQIVDHIDNDPLNNRRENLRLTDKRGNARNAKRRQDNTSGFKGVYRDNHSGTWIARIKSRGQKSHLGCFNTPEEAHKAYRKAATRYFGEFARFE